MPLYEFVCTECDDRFDALVRNFDATSEVQCESCDSPRVKRLISSFATVGGPEASPLPMSAPRAGGCCGGGCGCGH